MRLCLGLALAVLMPDTAAAADTQPSIRLPALQ